MAKTNKKAKRTAKPIVEAYLERIGQKVFKDFSYVIGPQGIVFDRIKPTAPRPGEPG